MKNAIFGAVGILALAACATTPQYGYYVDATGELVPQAELEPYSEWPEGYAGRTIRVETDSGVINNINFLPNGQLTIEVAANAPVVQGFYGVRGDTVCVNFVPRGEECWPNVPLAVGQTTTVTSNRGQDLQVTMYDNTGALNR